MTLLCKPETYNPGDTKNKMRDLTAIPCWGCSIFRTNSRLSNRDLTSPVESNLTSLRVGASTGNSPFVFTSALSLGIFHCSRAWSPSSFCRVRSVSAGILAPMRSFELGKLKVQGRGNAERRNGSLFQRVYFTIKVP